MIHRDWALAMGILVLTFVAVRVARTLLRRAKFAELATPISRSLYVVGLQLFVQAAPFHGRAFDWLSHLLYVLTVLVFSGIARRLALSAIEWSAFRTEPSSTLQNGFIPLLRNVITLFVFFAGAIMILQHFKYDVLSLLTALGVGSLAVGLAAKETLANMISGFTLIIDRNLHTGDRINLGGNIGDVEEIGLRSTRLRMPDGNMLIVPNAELVNTRLLNLSMPGRDTTCTAHFRVPAEIPFSQVRALATEAVSAVVLARKDKPPSVNLVSLADGHQLIAVGFWVADLEHVTPALSELNEKLLMRLQSEGIALVTPKTGS